MNIKKCFLLITRNRDTTQPHVSFFIFAACDVRQRDGIVAISTRADYAHHLCGGENLSIFYVGRFVRSHSFPEQRLISPYPWDDAIQPRCSHETETVRRRDANARVAMRTEGHVLPLETPMTHTLKSHRTKCPICRSDKPISRLR